MGSRARIATVCMNRRFAPTVEQNREHVLGLLDRVLIHKPDLVCLPEAFPTVSLPHANLESICEPVPGPTTDAAGRRARDHHCYIVCPLLTRRAGKFWNSAVVLDRGGGIAGIYDKVWPVTTTPDYTLLEEGITPGQDVPVFDLDIGRIGIQICFDINFREDWRLLAEKGARLVCWPSAYNGGFPLRAYACLHEYFVVSSVRSTCSQIVNPCGEAIARTDEFAEAVWRDVSLDFVVAHADFNYRVPDEIQAKYGDKVSVRSYADQAAFLIEPLADGLTAAQLQKEFSFESCAQYCGRHRKTAEQLRTGRNPHRQRPAHGARAQYSK
ncbi:MAG: carbon-nitrogen hydrolase family protein [Planctomycetota bacterium]|nr:carbon-nitrogen hydrolase family protein [Planctomycetota bacterium]